MEDSIQQDYIYIYIFVYIHMYNYIPICYVRLETYLGLITHTCKVCKTEVVFINTIIFVLH